MQAARAVSTRAGSEGSRISMRGDVRAGVLFAAWLVAWLVLGAPSPARAVPPEAVEPGREWVVGTITIRGNTVVKTSDITDAMLTKARPWYMSWQFWKDRPAFDPIVFKDDVDRI